MKQYGGCREGGGILLKYKYFFFVSKKIKTFVKLINVAVL